MIREMDRLTVRRLDKLLPEFSDCKTFNGGKTGVVICFTMDGVEYALDDIWPIRNYPTVESIDWNSFNDYNIGKAEYFLVHSIGRGGFRNTHLAMTMTHFLSINGVLI